MERVRSLVRQNVFEIRKAITKTSLCRRVYSNNVTTCKIPAQQTIKGTSLSVGSLGKLFQLFAGRISFRRAYRSIVETSACWIPNHQRNMNGKVKSRVDLYMKYVRKTASSSRASRWSEIVGEMRTKLLRCIRGFCVAWPRWYVATSSRVLALKS